MMLDNMDTGTLVLICAIFAYIVMVAFKLLRLLSWPDDYLRVKEREVVTMLHESIKIDYNITDKLQEFINNCFEDYLALNPINEVYISSDVEAKMRNDLSSIVSSRIAPAFIEEISLLYNESSIGNLIGDKIFITVASYVADFNVTKDELS